MRFQAAGDNKRKHLKAVAAKALDEQMPVILNEALQADPVRTEAIAILAGEVFGESPEPLPMTEGCRPRVAVPRSLDIPRIADGPTPELTKLVCLLISEGMPVQRAFRGVGLVRPVWESWWEQGETDAANGESTPYSRFVVELMREDVDVEAVIIRDMMKRKAGLWQAGMTFLERRAQDTYALQPQKSNLGEAAKGILEYFQATAAERAVPLPPSVRVLPAGESAPAEPMPPAPEFNVIEVPGG